MSVTVHQGDCRAVLATLPGQAVQCIVTSPPYYGLRDYGCGGQIGLEPTPDEYVAQMVAVFREARRVLRDDGTLWLNIGDSYNSATKGTGGATEKQATNAGSRFSARRFNGGDAKEKDLLGIPWALAFALRADGWYLRADIIWHKPNPMPESVRDRPTKAHEYVFLLSKQPRYFYDAAAISEPFECAAEVRVATPKNLAMGKMPTRPMNAPLDTAGRNARSVWTIATQPFSGAHFATMPPDLAERCIKAGSRPGDTVLDPFGGAGTTGLVASRLQRSATLIELNPEYAAMARARVRDDAPLIAEVA